MALNIYLFQIQGQSRTFKFCTNPGIKMDDNIVKFVGSHNKKCLGVDLDNRLIFDSYIDNLCKKIFWDWCLEEN